MIAAGAWLAAQATFLESQFLNNAPQERAFAMTETEIARMARYANLKKLHAAQGDLAYLLQVFGDTLAQQQGYTHIDGMEAIYLYLIHKHHWLPRDVRAMTPDDLRLALHQEMQGWTAPAAAR